MPSLAKGSSIPLRLLRLSAELTSPKMYGCFKNTKYLCTCRKTYGTNLSLTQGYEIPGLPHTLGYDQTSNLGSFVHLLSKHNSALTLGESNMEDNCDGFEPKSIYTVK